MKLLMSLYWVGIVVFITVAGITGLRSEWIPSIAAAACALVWTVSGIFVYKTYNTTH